MMRKRRSDLTSWLTKIQAAEEIGVGTKTVDRLADDGTLQKELRQRVGMAPVAVFHPRDVQQEKERRTAADVIPSKVEVPVNQQSNMFNRAVRMNHETQLDKDLCAPSIDMQNKLLGADVTITLRMPAEVLDWFKKQGKNRKGDMPPGQVILESLFSVYLEGCGEELQAKTHLLNTYAVRFGTRPSEEPDEESTVVK